MLRFKRFDVMDTPKRQVSWLETFPPDIWAYFAWYLPGEQLGRLMMTGATLMWQRLKSPGVVKSIELGEGLIVFKSFPAFLRELPSVDELLILSPSANWSDALGMTIDSLPSGLRKLELSGFWNPATFKLLGEPGATLKLCDCVPHLTTLYLGFEPIGDYSWLAHTPQSLTRLHLDWWYCEIELPSSLIHFTTRGVHCSEEDFAPKLPPSLESFVVSDHFMGIDFVVPLLPPSTRKLSIGYRVQCELSEQELFEKFPKFLTSLQVRVYLNGIDFKSNPELTVLFPPTLTDLNLQIELPCSAWPLLPQQLTRLSCIVPDQLSTVVSIFTDHDGIEKEFKSVPFDCLPRSITRLELQASNANIDQRIFCDFPSGSNQSYFPPQLAHLILDGLELTPGAAQLLPSSLTFLRIGVLCERACEHLPSSLKTLICYRLETTTPNATLPQRLTSLESEFFNCIDLSPLPSTLTRISLQAAQQLGDSFLQYQQLPYLQELELTASKHFTDLSITLLSPHLTSLDLERSSTISGKSFPFLPRCLTRLNLDHSESIFDSDIQHLPRTLKCLRLSHAIHLTNLCIPDLPPRLNFLDVKYNSQIESSCVPQLPYTLRSCQNSSYATFSTWDISGGNVKEKKRLEISLKSRIS